MKDEDRLSADHPDNPALSDVVERNVHKLIQLRREAEQARSAQDKIADALTAFSGNMFFVYLHVAWFAIWIAINARWTPFKPFDPFPFGLLTLIVSLEAIFLSTFVLISQNRQADISDNRADLDLHIDLLSEYEITRILTLVDAIADKLGCKEGQDPELSELEKDVAPEKVLEEIEQWKKRAKRD